MAISAFISRMYRKLKKQIKPDGCLWRFLKIRRNRQCGEIIDRNVFNEARKEGLEEWNIEVVILEEHVAIGTRRVIANWKNGK